MASIVASLHRPEFIVNVRETGRDHHGRLFRHEGAEAHRSGGGALPARWGWDSTKRYFMVAANQNNKIGVIDSKTDTVAAVVDVGRFRTRAWCQLQAPQVRPGMVHGPSGEMKPCP